MVSLVDHHTVSGLNDREILFVLVDETIQVSFVCLHNAFGAVAALDAFNENFYAFDVLEENVVLLAADEIFAILQRNNVAIVAEVQCLNELALALD
jgi:hypothetical protein